MTSTLELDVARHAKKTDKPLNPSIRHLLPTMNTEQTYRKPLGQIAYENDSTSSDAKNTYQWGDEHPLCHARYERMAKAIATEVLKRAGFQILPEGTVMQEGDEVLGPRGWERVGRMYFGDRFELGGEFHNLRRLSVPEKQPQKSMADLGVQAWEAHNADLVSPEGVRPPVQKSPHQEADVPPTCAICRIGDGNTVSMVLSKAIPEAMVNMGEGQYSGGSHVGNAPLVDVWKCPECGHSFRADAPPSPRAEWKPRFKIGDKVRGVASGALLGKVSAIRDGTKCYEIELEDGQSGGTFGEDQLEPAPWKLPEPPEGMQWHRVDWTREMLPEGWRPILKGEPYLPSGGDQRLYGGSWESGGIDLREADWHNTNLRTHRPLPISPVPKPEKRLCIHCGLPIEGAMIGAGDGTGQKFAHPECYYRKDAERLRKERDAALAHASEAEKQVEYWKARSDSYCKDAGRQMTRADAAEKEIANLQIHNKQLSDEYVSSTESALKWRSEWNALRASVPVWVPCRTKMPTEKDADKQGCVWIWNQDSRNEPARPIREIHWKNLDPDDSHVWMKPVPPPLPVETEEGDGFEEWWKEMSEGNFWLNEIHKTASRKAWQAALRSKKPPLGSP